MTTNAAASDTGPEGVRMHKGAFLTTRQLADLLEVNYQLVVRWIREGKLTPSVVMERRSQSLFSWDELRNFLKVAIHYGVWGPWHRAKLPGPNASTAKPKSFSVEKGAPLSVAHCPDERIAAALALAKGNQSKAAKALGIDRKTIRNRLAKRPELGRSHSAQHSLTGESKE